MKLGSFEVFLMAMLSCLIAICSGITSFAADENMDGVTVYYEIPDAGLSGHGSENLGGKGDSNIFYSEDVVAIVNEERAKAGLNPLTVDESMMEGARIRAQEQKSLFSHTRPDGRQCFTIFTDLEISTGYRGENVAYASLCTPWDIMNGWMSSEGHKENILNPRFTRIGVGYYENGDFGYWAQLFAE